MLVSLWMFKTDQNGEYWCKAHQGGPTGAGFCWGLSSCVLMWPLLCGLKKREKSSYKDISPSGVEPPLGYHITVVTSLDVLSPSVFTARVRSSVYEFVGCIFQSQHALLIHIKHMCWTLKTNPFCRWGNRFWDITYHR